MKTNILVYLFCTMLISITMISCKEEKIGNVGDITGLGGDVWAKGPIDVWISDNYVKPYNIAVKYKWDQFEFSDLSKTLVPAKEEQVIPLLTSISRAWIKPYVDVAGKEFFNRYSPKNIILSGSVSYNSNGTVTAGQAEGGRKVVLMGVNDFKVKGMEGYSAERDSAYAMFYVFQVIQHEFAHILHQNKFYSPTYKTLSAGKYYGSDWINFNDYAARADGFITAYAGSGYDDDFAEMVAIMLIVGKEGFENIINSIPEGSSMKGTTKEQAQEALRKKEAIVVSYFKTEWNIDFYKLQQKIHNEMIEVF